MDKPTRTRGVGERGQMRGRAGRERRAESKETRAELQDKVRNFCTKIVQKFFGDCFTEFFERFFQEVSKVSQSNNRI